MNKYIKQLIYEIYGRQFLSSYVCRRPEFKNKILPVRKIITMSQKDEI